MTKKLNQKRRPIGAGAVVPASPATTADNLLATLKRNAEKAAEPALKQRLYAAIAAIETRRA
jgi:hypothetical protein